MMQEMVKQCCTDDGKPDFAKMEQCGKQRFSDDELAMLKQCCGREGVPDAEKIKQMMERCGCRVA